MSRAAVSPAASPGDAVDAVDTPALVIDLDAMERNLAAMAAFARDHDVLLRPHAKMHKCAAIARLQIEAGAVGVCVQKVGEAEALADAGIGDIFVSNEVVAESKLVRFAALAGRIRLTVVVDSVLGIERLAAALKAAGTSAGVFVEIDVGHGRGGVPPAVAASLAHQVVAHGLAFAGLHAYQGAAQHLRKPQAREAAIAHAVACVRAAEAGITSAGLPCPLVTGAGTGSFVFEAASGVYGELQPGSYLFLDADYAQNELAATAPRFEHALFVKSQVMSRSSAHAVVDAGHKSHAIDAGLPRVWQRPLIFGNGGDEHGILRLQPTASVLAADADADIDAEADTDTDTDTDTAAAAAAASAAAAAAASALPQLGETVWLVPGHCDPTVNLHDHLIAVRGGLTRGVVEAIWPVDARGCVR